MALLVAITVDVETPQTPMFAGRCTTDLLDPMVDGERLGYSFIVRQLNRFGVRGVFFVNVYESALWGDDVLQAVCQDILSQGHEVALHTHPACRYDRARPHMWQYSAEEQIQIIADGLQMLRRWLPGYDVTAHRAGAYGLNEDTIRALHFGGIPVDSSMFYGHPNCKLTWSKNRVGEKDGLLEVPVTGFFRERCLKLGVLVARRSRSFIKTDVDWSSLDELRFFAKEAEKHGLRVMNLLMHSYSFLRVDSHYTCLEPDHKHLAKFEHLLLRISTNPQIRVVTMKELYELHRRDPAMVSGSDHVPVTSYGVSLLAQARASFSQMLGISK